MEFNTVSISDGITMGTEGMRASLVSREVIADSIELVARGNVLRRPGRAGRLRQDDSRRASMALARLEHSRPGALRRLDRAGPLARPRRHDPGRLRSGRRARRRHDERRRARRARGHACPGAGACGGQFTANTMATVCEFLGIAPLGSGSVPATDRSKARRRARSAGALVMDLLAARLAAARRSSRATALENAIASVAATGGSTNAVLHLLAIAQRSGRRARRSTISIASARACRSLADLKPAAASSRPICTRAGGMPLVAQAAARGGLHRTATP